MNVVFHALAGGALVALETGNNSFVSSFNHVLVIASALLCIFVGSAAFDRKLLRSR